MRFFALVALVIVEVEVEVEVRAGGRHGVQG